MNYLILSFFKLILVLFGSTYILEAQPKVKISETVTIHSQFKGMPVVEPNLSVHPKDNDHLLVAAMIVTDINKPYQSSRLSTFASINGGTTWKETTHNYWGYDPWASILPDGQTALAWLGTKKSFQHQFPIQFFSSDDGGISWEENVQTIQSEHGHDGTKIATLGEDFYFTTVRFNGDMSADVILYHRSGEGDFKEVAKIPGQGTRLNFCEPAILSDGTVLVPSSHFLRKLWVQAYSPNDHTLSDKQLVTINPGGGRGYMRLIADTNPDSKYLDRVYLVRATDNSRQSEGVWLNYATDSGKIWSRDIRVDSFDNQLPSKAMLASIAVNKEGIIGISWVDSQHDPTQQKNDVYFTYSLDGGVHFQPPIRVTKISTDPETSSNGQAASHFPGGGHYLDIQAKADSSFQLIWSDSRSGVFELQTCNLTISP